MPKLSSEVAIHLDKARDSALLAVEIYNRPRASFRSAGFIVMMCIAWTALFHAIFLNRRTKPFYRSRTNPRRYERVDGDRKAWELSTCLNKYWGNEHPSVRLNVEFFIELRNKIEHRSMPGLDLDIFGECQAMLFNFEDLLVSEFGDKYAINEALSFALQFSCQRNEVQLTSMKKLHKKVAKDIISYIDRFRTALSTEQLQDLKFSYKVFLFPKPANREGTADLAVEFVKYDSGNPEEMSRINRAVALIKHTETTRMVPGEYTGGDGAIPVRLVNDPNAPAVRGVNYNETHPHLQKHVQARLAVLVPEAGLKQHDLTAIRLAHRISNNPDFYYKSKFGSPQYTDSYIQWIVDEVVGVPGALQRAHDAYKEILRRREANISVEV